MGKLNMKIKNKQNKGQVAIIVLLASAILLTLGISASKQTVTDTKIETDEEALKEAFNTAESGINNYLNIGSTTYTAEGSGATVDSATIGGGNSIASEGKVIFNSNQLFWLVNHDNGDIGATYYGGATVTLSFDTNYTGALKIDYFYIDGIDYKVKRWGYNCNNDTVVSGFERKNGDSIQLDLPLGESLLISVTPIGQSTTLTLSGNSNFPQQGEELTSTGVTSSGVKTQVKTRYIYQIPSFFMEAVTAANVIQ